MSDGRRAILFHGTGGNPDVAWLAGAGISTGTDLGGGRFEFRPTAPVSRQAMAAFLHRLDAVLAPA